MTHCETVLETKLRFSLVVLPSWVSPIRPRKRQVMSPTMAPVPASPFTFSQLLRSQYLLLLLLPVLGLCTGTVNVPILLSSISLAHFSFRNRSMSRAESLFTTVFTHTTTTDCRFNVASMHNFAVMIAIITIVLAKSPTRVTLPHATNVFPVAWGVYSWQVGAENPTGPPNKQGRHIYRFHYYYYSHFHFHTSTYNPQFTALTGLAQLTGGIGVVYGGSCDCCLVSWQFAYICLYQFHPKSGRLFRKNSLFSRSARAASIQEKGRKRANDTGWAPRLQLYPSFVPSAFTEVLDFHFWQRTGSLHAIYLLDFHFWHRTASFTAMPRLDVYWVCLTCSPFVESAFFIGLFTTLLSCVAASFARQT